MGLPVSDVGLSVEPLIASFGSRDVMMRVNERKCLPSRNRKNELCSVFKGESRCEEKDGLRIYAKITKI